MNDVRKYLGRITTALLVAAFSLFAGAASAQKIYTMAVQAVAPGQVAVTIQNVTPPSVTGNSTINSFQVNMPSGVTFLSGGGSSAAATIFKCPDGTNACVNAFNGLKSGGKNPNTLTVTLNVSYAGGPPTCGTSISWTSIAYTGNFSNTTFQLVDINNNNTSISSVPESLNCYTLTGLPGASNPLAAGTSSVSVPNVILTNTNGPGGASITSIAIAGGTGVTVGPTSIAPLAPGASTSLTLSVSTACGTAAGNWSATVTGPSTTFSGTPNSANYAVNSCTIAFNPTPPANIGNGIAIAPSVGITARDGNGALLNWNGVVTWTVTGTSTGASGSANTPTPKSSCASATSCSTWTYPDLAISGVFPGNYTLKASAALGSSTTTTATAPTAFALWGGVLGCDSTNNTSGDLNVIDQIVYNQASDQGKWGLTRGANKTVTDPICVVVPYTFTLDITPPRQKASFIVPSGTGQTVAVEYVIAWGRKNVIPASTSNGQSLWTMDRPKLSWGIANPDPNTNDFVPGLACVKDPADFSAVTTAQMPGLLPLIPDAPPFNTPYNATSCPNCIKGNPAYPQYQPNTPALMCVAQHGWTAVGSDANGTLVQYWTKIIDQGDGFVIND